MDLLPGKSNNRTRPLAADKVVGDVDDALELQPASAPVLGRVQGLGFRVSGLGFRA